MPYKTCHSMCSNNPEVQRIPYIKAFLPQLQRLIPSFLQAKGPWVQSILLTLILVLQYYQDCTALFSKPTPSRRIRVAKERHPSSQWCITSFSLVFGNILFLAVRSTPPSVSWRRVLMMPQKTPYGTISLGRTYYPAGTGTRHPPYFKG